MSDEIFANVTHFLVANNFKGTLNFGSGEPFLYPKFVDRLKVLMEKLPECRFRILTNGTSLSKIPEWILNDKRIVVGVTLDGMKKDDLKGLQVGVDPQDVIRDYLLTKDKLDQYYFNYTVTKQSLYSVPSFLDFCLENNVPNTYLTELRVWKEFADVLDKQKPDRERLKKIFESYKSKFIEKGLDLSCSTIDDDFPYRCYEEGKNRLIIDVDGSVTFCSGREESIITSVDDKAALLKITQFGQQLMDNPNNNWCEFCSTRIDQNEHFYVSKTIYVPSLK